MEHGPRGSPWKDIVTEADIEVDGRRWHYYLAGHEGAPSVVFVHGFHGSGRFFGRALLSLGDGWRAIAPDLPGHGASEPWDPDERAVEQWSLLEGFMDALGLGPVALVGVSRGGAVSIQMAAIRPERVRALVLVSSSGIPFKVGPLNIREMVADPSVLTDEVLYLVRHATEAARGYDAARSRAMAEGALERDTGQRLGTIQTPTLIVWGSEDRTIPVEVGIRLREGIEGSSMTVLQGAGHLLLFERPREVERLLREFLAEHYPPP